LVYEGTTTGKFPPELERLMRKKLWQLNAAQELSDLRVPPGNNLKKLGRDRKGQFSIRVNDQFRICFTWDNDAYDVEINNHYQ
jgi:proteic killer suppression protein